MPITSAAPANDLINTVLSEVGLGQSTDPWASTDTNIVQMRTLLQLAGEELCWFGDWNHLERSHSITTSSADSGVYPLPSDYLTMIAQTGWEQTNRTPLRGPLSPQEWAYLEGRQYVNQTIYASFRLTAGTFEVFPQPVPDGLVISFEYRSKNWVEDPSSPGDFIDTLADGAHIPRFDRTLMTRYLKYKFLDAKGFDVTAAQRDVERLFDLADAGDKSGKILNAGARPTGYPYLDTFRNVRDTGFGSV